MNVLFKRRLLFGYKHIRFKSTFQTMSIEFKDAMHLRTSKLADLLDCTNFTAREIIFRNKNILAIDSTTFIQNAKFCAAFLKLSDVIEFPCLLSLNPSLLQHRYFSLMELGCSNISGDIILRYLQVIKKSSKLLEKEGILFSLEKNIDTCINLLDTDCDRKKVFAENILHMHQDGNSLKEIKTFVNERIFASKLNCSSAETGKLFRRYPPLRVQSIGNTLKLFDVLLRRYSFPTSKLHCFPAVLSIHHEAVDHFIDEIPDILGVSTNELVHKLPILLKQPIKSVQQVEKILQSFDITDRHLLNCPKVMTFPPKTIQKRLDVLCSSDDFRLFKKNKRFLWLLFHFNKLDTRLEILNTFNKPPSISMFISNDSIFENSLLQKKCPSHSYKVMLYLTEVLKCSMEDIKDKLHEFPKLGSASLSNCSEVVEYLLNCGVTKKQLSNGLIITLYDIEVVKGYFEPLENHPKLTKCQPFSDWRTHYNFLQLLILTIEWDSGFRGPLYAINKRPTWLDNLELKGGDSEDTSVSNSVF